MSKDKILLVLLTTIAVAAFCGGVLLCQRVEKDGLFQGQSTWKYLNKRFLVLLAESEKKNPSSLESQAVHARLLHNVGVTYGYTDQWTDSIKTLNQSLDFKMKSKSVKAESVIRSIESLGKAYFLTGKYEIARTALDFAARDWVREHGEESLDYARCMGFTGRVHLSMGDFKLAESCFETAMAIFKKEDDRSSLARLHLLIAQSAIARDDLQKSRQQLDRAIALLKIDFGDDYRTYFNDEVALLNCLEGQLLIEGELPEGAAGSAVDRDTQIDTGLKLINDGFRVAIQSYGTDDVYTQAFRLILAEGNMKKRDISACISTLQQIEASFQRIGLPNHPFLARVYDLYLKALKIQENQRHSGNLNSRRKSLTDVLQAKLKKVEYSASQSSQSESDALASRLNYSTKFLANRNFNDPWLLPLTTIITVWAFSGMFACSLACAAQAGRKDYVSSVWFLLGVVFNLVAYLVITALPSRSTFTKEFGADFALVNDARHGVFLLAMTPLAAILGASIFYYPAPVRDLFIAVFLGFCVCLIFFPPIWCFEIAKSKGRNQYLWVLIGLFTSVFGLVFLLLLKEGDKAEVDEEETRNTHCESAMLLVSAIHIALFVGIVANIYHSWMLHLEL
ncbi:MAG: tetratricopeptide repeat protein [Candidatus Melainabacteria bacterium]|nr:tetratricopeptide repeat protein [Candidatus Melainabacteria bacterium]